ncbi:MAG: DUF1850 domain-containing protein [Clostridiaceae bacterium]|nr:DUF1850 domain-containing protein [Clostridiaceae bacterium]
MNNQLLRKQQRKHIRTSSVVYEETFIRIAITAIALMILLVYYQYFHTATELRYMLTIIEEKTTEDFVAIEVNVGDIVEFHWIHSVEHIPWIETFMIDDEGKFMLIETKFKGFGAGVPHEKEGKVKVEDGYVIMTELEERFEAYTWIHSHSATEKITLNGMNIVKAKDLPHHGFVKMKVQER